MADKNLEKNNNGKAKLVWHYMSGAKALFVLTMVSSVIMALADMLIPQVIRIAIDYCMAGSDTTNMPIIAKVLTNSLGGIEFLTGHIYILAIVIVIVAAVRAIFTYLFRVSDTAGSEKMVKNMRDELFDRILRLPFSWHMTNKTGDVISRCTSDIETIRAFVADKLSEVLRIVLLLVLSLVFMLTMNPMLALIAFIPIPAIVAYSIYFHQRLMPGFMECDVNEGILSDMAQENFTGVRVVRAFGQEKKEKARFEKHNEYYTGLWVKMAKTMATFWSVTDILCFMQILLTMIFGVVFCINGSMLPGEFVAFMSYNGMLSWPIRELGRMIVDLSKTGVSIERIKYIVDAKVERDRDGAIEAPMKGDIVFDHVSFSYDESTQILKDISFTMKGGSTLGILGGTGSGKSTMMLLLDRLYELPEKNGTISIGGVDIRNIKSAHLRKNIGMVLQEPYLFSRTLAENIGITKDDFDLRDIEPAVESACLKETIEDFTKGYDTFVGERGVTLSGGQKQRTAIARTLVQHAPIMIFDDSLSAVDTATDEKIRKQLQKEFGTASIILISHRISTVKGADKILVLNKGRLVEEGTHDSLRSAGGIYQKIYELQNGIDSSDTKMGGSDDE